MPLLTEEQRALEKAAKDAFDFVQANARHYRSVGDCRFCGKAISSLVEDEDWTDAVKRHERRHKGYDEWIAACRARDKKVGMFASLHDHDCIEGVCQCICGCRNVFGCSSWGGGMCSICATADIRGDENHELRIATPSS